VGKKRESFHRNNKNAKDIDFSDHDLNEFGL
jgi:hypothetical protein